MKKVFLLIMLGMFLMSFAYAEDLNDIELGDGKIIDEKIAVDSYCLVQDTKAMIEKCSELSLAERADAIQVKLDEQKLLVKQDGLYLKDEVTSLEAKIEEKQSSSVYIHKFEKGKWHVDNLNPEPISVYLDLPYNSQPYKIMHYDKNDNYVTTFYKGQYEWLANCIGEECQDSSGIARIYATISAESIGSDIFEIGNATSGWITQGQYYAKFDGVDDYVNSNPILNLNSQNISFSFWINTKSFNGVGGGSDNRIEIITLKNSTDAYLVRIQYTNSTGEFNAYFINSTGGLSNPTMSNGSLALNEWQNIQIVRNSTNTWWYLNGKIKRIRTNTGDVKLDPWKVYIGGGSLGYFNGSISQVQIYNRSLSDAEVLAEYNKFNLTGLGGSPLRNSAPNTNGLVAYYPFDDASVADFSGNNNSGTNYGATFGPVKYQTVSLVNGVDYNLTSEGVFTVSNPKYYFGYLFASWEYDDIQINFVSILLPFLAIALIVLAIKLALDEK